MINDGTGTMVSKREVAIIFKRNLFVKSRTRSEMFLGQVSGPYFDIKMVIIIIMSRIILFRLNILVIIPT